MSKKTRIEIPNEIANEVMVSHDSTCCVCKIAGKPTQIHHIDENPANNTIHNLAVLCLECHNKTMIKGGFGRNLNAGQVTLYRNEWLELVKKRKHNLSQPLPIITQGNLGCWEKIDFGNQCGIEYAIAGRGLNQNNVESCPKLPIFGEAYKSIETLNSVNIIGESGSGKSLTAFQIAYEYSKNGYEIFIYNGDENISIVNQVPSLYIIDNAHLYKKAVENMQKQVNKNIKLICVYTDSLDIKDGGIRITAKQAVDVLHEHYKKNAVTIIPIVKTFNRKYGVDFGKATYSWLLNRARIEKTPYYFNYIIRGAADYIKDKIEDYAKEGFGEKLTIIAIYQILNADDFISIDKINEILNTQIIPVDFTNKLVFNDKILVSNKSGYKFSHLHTAINYLNYYILKSFDNQTFANKIFWAFFDANTYSLLGILWLINNANHHINIKYSTNRNIYSLFDKIEINTIFDKLHARKQEPYFLSVVERMEHYLENDKVAEKIDEYIEIINSCPIIDLPSAGDYINMQINKGRDDNYNGLKKIQNGIDYSRILMLFNEANSNELINFIRFFNRIGYGFKNWRKKISSHLNIDTFLLKINNISLDKLYCVVELADTFYSHDNKLVQIRDACTKKILYFLKLNPIETWQHVDSYPFYTFFGYYNCLSRRIRYSEYYKNIRKRFIESIDTKLLATEIETNVICSWQTIAELMEAVFTFDKNTYMRIIDNIDLNILSKNLNGLWDTGQEFEFLNAFCYKEKTLEKLIEICESEIEHITSSILFFSTDGAIYLRKKGKVFNFKYIRNDYIFVMGLLNLIKKDKPMGLNLLIQNKDKIIEFIKRTIYDHGDDDGDKKLKEYLHKHLKGLESDLSSAGLSETDLSIFTNFKNYNFANQMDNEKR